MPRLGNINQYEQKKAQRKADALPAVQAASPSFISQAQVNNPTLEEMTWKNTGIVPIPGQGEYRTQALRDMNEDEFAKHQQAMNASDKEYWVEQAKINPTSSYVNLRNYLASQETPEQKQKRERREQLGEVFNNLGNLIGNAANLYYTTKGGQYIDLNSVNEKHRARMERLREKQEALKQRQDELLGRAKIADVKAKREEATAKAKAEADAKAKELEYKRDLALKQIEHAFRIGQIDAQTAANMKRDAAKANSDKELEAFKQKNRLTLKSTPSFGQDDIVESFTDTDGTVWTRTKPFSDAEKAEAFESLPMEIQQMFTVEQYDNNNNVTSRRVDYNGALGYAIKHGFISNPEQRGFKKKEGKRDYSQYKSDDYSSHKRK